MELCGFDHSCVFFFNPNYKLKVTIFITLLLLFSINSFMVYAQREPMGIQKRMEALDHNGIFVTGYDFGNQECSVNTHSRIPSLHILACFQYVDSINGYLKYIPLSTLYATVLGWNFLFSSHQNLSVVSAPSVYLRDPL